MTADAVDTDLACAAADLQHGRKCRSCRQRHNQLVTERRRAGLYRTRSPRKKGES